MGNPSNSWMPPKLRKYKGQFLFLKNLRSCRRTTSPYQDVMALIIDVKQATMYPFHDQEVIFRSESSGSKSLERAKVLALIPGFDSPQWIWVNENSFEENFFNLPIRKQTKKVSEEV